MSRSIWKGPVIKNRSTTITPLMIGKILKVHNGKNYNYVLITNNHVGLKIGELVFSKVPAIFKKQK